MKKIKVKAMIFMGTILCFGVVAKASTVVNVHLNEELAENLMNSFYLAEVVPRVTTNELGTIETTYIGLDQVKCVFEGLVDSDTHPSKTLIQSNYQCVENDSRSPDNKLAPGPSALIMKAVEKVVTQKSDLAGAASFFINQVDCVGIYNVFPLEQGGTRTYVCDFDVRVDYEAE